jgi:DNA polymerase III alpha subunit
MENYGLPNSAYESSQSKNSSVDFVHLHVHSDYSLLDSAASVEALAAKAASLGMKHLAITDYGNMFGVLDFVNACQGGKDHPLKGREAVHPIIGSEFYMSSGSRHEKRGSESGNRDYHLVLLSTCAEGYHNLMKLSSLSFTEGFYYKPRIDKEALEQYHNGLICLSACLAGEIPSLIMNGNVEQAEKTALWFRDLMGEDNFYLELQDHGIAEQKRVNTAIADIAQRTGIPLVATNDVHYLEREDAMAHDILYCIGTGKRRDEERRMRYYGDQFYLKSGDEMAALFNKYPEAIANTVRIAERCKTEIPPVAAKDLSRYLTDFDVDFCNEHREEVIDYVSNKYGKERVGRIITFSTLGARQVIKDVARVMDISLDESNMIAKLIPEKPKMNLTKALNQEPRLQELAEDPKYMELFIMARKLEGLHRHSGIHATGVVIGKSALHNFVPLCRDLVTGNIVTQYTADFLENCGLVKVDFLRRKTLDIIRYSEELIRHRGGKYATFDIKTISKGDPPEADAAFNYLKANFPAEFIAANMTNEIGAADKGKLPKYIDEARKMNIEVVPPDINCSEVLFTVSEGRIVYGLRAIKGIGERPAGEILRVRNEGGPFKDFMDFLDRTGVHLVSKKDMELLIKAGAFDRFGIARSTLLGNMKRAVDYAQHKKDLTQYGQMNLLSESGEKEYPDFEFEPFDDFCREDRLN